MHSIMFLIRSCTSNTPPSRCMNEYTVQPAVSAQITAGAELDDNAYTRNAPPLTWNTCPVAKQGRGNEVDCHACDLMHLTNIGASCGKQYTVHADHIQSNPAQVDSLSLHQLHWVL
jgi:hypothetical protein